MTWAVLAVFVLVLVALGLARYRDRLFTVWRSAPGMGVEGSRKLGKKTRAALAAATTMLR